MAAAGKWFITPHAVDRYRERSGQHRLTYEQALGELIHASQAAHFVKVLNRGLELWRGGRPRRLRFLVQSSTGPGELPSLVTVYAGHDPEYR